MQPGSEADLAETLFAASNVSSKERQAVILLDGYSFDTTFQASIRHAGHQIVIIDDVADRDGYAADIIINPNPGAEGASYRGEVSSLALLGRCFTLVRHDVRAMRQSIHVAARVHRILVTIGGSDEHNVSLAVMRALSWLTDPSITITVVAGPTNSHLPELLNLPLSTDVRFEVLHAPDNFAELMASADVAITAAGNTCWELAYLGIPMIALETAPNQRVVADALQKAGAAIIVDVGRLNSSLISKLEPLLKSDKLRQQMSEAGQSLIDGRGVERVVMVASAALSSAKLDGYPIELRRAKEDDVWQLWRTANDPVVRAHSFNRPEISREEHDAWFRLKISSPDTLFLVMELGTVVIGQVRYERRGSEAEVHFSVAAGFRGKGLGVRLLMESFAIAREYLKVDSVTAVVRNGNAASQKAFVRAGYIPDQRGSSKDADSLNFRRDV